MRVNCEEMRVINKPIEDVIKNEINNCMKYDPYKVCIILGRVFICKQRI